MILLAFLADLRLSFLSSSPPPKLTILPSLFFWILFSFKCCYVNTGAIVEFVAVGLSSLSVV